VCSPSCHGRHGVAVGRPRGGPTPCPSVPLSVTMAGTTHFSVRPWDYQCRASNPFPLGGVFRWNRPNHHHVGLCRSRQRVTTKRSAGVVGKDEGSHSAAPLPVPRSSWPSVPAARSRSSPAPRQARRPWHSSGSRLPGVRCSTEMNMLRGIDEAMAA
jgi:hypothetical protein